jgi:hypothetical protein
MKVMKPKIILSDHGSQFTSIKWKKTTSALGIEIQFSPIRNPESNPTERLMTELGKYFRIYCNETHKKWPELIPYIEKWINYSVNSATGYTPIELLGGENKLKLFETFKLPSQSPLKEEDLPTKLLRVYTHMKSRSEKKQKAKREGKFKCKLKIGDSVVAKCHHASEAVQGLIGKFQRPFEGPYTLVKKLNPNMYELQDESGNSRGLFHLSHLKPYLMEGGSKSGRTQWNLEPTRLLMERDGNL